MQQRHVSGFFDNLEHSTLLNKIKKMLGVQYLQSDLFKVFEFMTRHRHVEKSDLDSLANRKELIHFASYLDVIDGAKVSEKMRWMKQNKILHMNDESYGIPQGTPISAVLSNIYMIDFDELFCGLENVFYRRYSDDILLVCEQEDVESFRQLLLEELSNIYLKSNEKKLKIVSYEKKNDKLVCFDYKTKLNTELQYLGFVYDGRKVCVRPQTISKYYLKMNRRIGRHVNMAYSRKGFGNKVLRKKIYKRYSHVGQNGLTFYRYVYKSNEAMAPISGNSIRKQFSKHVQIIERKIQRKVKIRQAKKSKRGKFINRY